ncbi:cytochrome b/b6 domain-containing protein [Microvirga terricola]|uniref:cytochrome b/b6 domain-containing protein n=1 Tax=Microvirga terricola TaxID=2719797 RepID=UPI001431024F
MTEGPSGEVIMVKTCDVPRSDADLFEEDWASSLELMRRQPGFVSATLHKPIDSGGPFISYVNYVVWRNANALAGAWQKVSAFATILAAEDFHDAVAKARDASAQHLYAATQTAQMLPSRTEPQGTEPAHRDVRGLQSTKDRYGPVAIALHWISAFLILLAVPLGFAIQNVGEESRVAIFLAHATIGVTVGILTLIRLAWWTLADRRPGRAPDQSRFMHALVGGVYLFFYFALLFLALGGIFISIAKILGPTLATSLPGIVPYLHLPVPVHNLVARLFVTMLILHVVAALYHHWVKRDGTMTRMSPPQKDHAPAFAGSVAAAT